MMLQPSQAIRADPAHISTQREIITRGFFCCCFAADVSGLNRSLVIIDDDYFIFYVCM